MNNFAGRVYVWRQSFSIRIEPRNPEPVIPPSVRAGMPPDPLAVRLAWRALDWFDRVFRIGAVPTSEQWFGRAVCALVAIAGAFVAGYWGVV